MHIETKQKQNYQCQNQETCLGKKKKKKKKKKSYLRTNQTCNN